MWPFKKKVAPEAGLKPLKVERPGLGFRLKQKPKQYTGIVALVYNGKPLRQFTIQDKGYSRDIVAAKIEKGLSLKLVSVVQDKKLPKK